MYRKTRISIVLSLLALNLCRQVSASENLGHRGGCKLSEENRPADNSIECLKLVKKHENNPKLDYLEFDVWEIKDNGLVVIHGGNKILGGRGHVFVGKHSTISYDRANREKCKTFISRKCKKHIKLTDLTVDEIQELLLNDSYNQYAASLSEYINEIKKLGIKTPIRVDIKQITSELAAESLFIELSELREQLNQNNLANNMSQQSIAIWAKRKKRYKADHQFICALSAKYNIGVYYKPTTRLCSEEKKNVRH